MKNKSQTKETGSISDFKSKIEDLEAKLAKEKRLNKFHSRKQKVDKDEEKLTRKALMIKIGLESF